MTLLVENVPVDLLDQEIIVEGTGTEKKYYIAGPYIESEVRNRNKRIYPKPVIEREVARYNKEMIATNRALGELDHPDTTEINLDRASHLIKELKMDKNIGYGKAVLLDTPMGKIAKALVDEGVKLGVSTRGYGSIRESVVQNDYKLVTVDIVSDPSAPSAFVDGIMESTIEWLVEDDVITMKDADKIAQGINNIKQAKPITEDVKITTLNIFKKFLEELKGKI